MSDSLRGWLRSLDESDEKAGDVDKPVSIFEIGNELRLQWIERGHKWSPRSEQEVEQLVRERRRRERGT